MLECLQNCFEFWPIAAASVVTIKFQQLFRGRKDWIAIAYNNGIGAVSRKIIFTVIKCSSLAK